MEMIAKNVQHLTAKKMANENNGMNGIVNQNKDHGTKRFCQHFHQLWWHWHVIAEVRLINKKLLPMVSNSIRGLEAEMIPKSL